MMVTEAEAAGKWCPFSRAMRFREGQHPPVGGINRGVSDLHDTACIGSQCMAWVWIESERKRGSSEPVLGRCGLVRLPE
jgi:hypothetical protein